MARVRCRVLMVVVPGEEGRVRDWYEGVGRDLGEECGVDLPEEPRLRALLGPYDFVLDVTAESVDDIGMLVGWMRDRLGGTVSRTVTLIERTGPRVDHEEQATGEGHGRRREEGHEDGQRMEAKVLILSRPDASFERPGDPTFKTLEAQLKELQSEIGNEGGPHLDIIEIFGEYDYIVEFTCGDLDELAKAVDKLRKKVGRSVIQTVTLVEWRVRTVLQNRGGQPPLRIGC